VPDQAVQISERSSSRSRLAKARQWGPSREPHLLAACTKLTHTAEHLLPHHEDR
jgi:hypothetical protein